MKKIIIAYIPVVHEGYRTFLQKHADAEVLYILGKDITNDFKPLTKDIHALDPELIKKTLQTLSTIARIEVLDKKSLKELAKQKSIIIMPKEDVCLELKEKYFTKNTVKFDSIFLRWDKHASVGEKPVIANGKISRSVFDKKIIKTAFKVAEQSSDFGDMLER